MVEKAFRREVAIAGPVDLPDGVKFTLSNTKGISLTRLAPKVALAEFVIFFACAYFASVVYHQAVYGGSPSHVQYGTTSLLLASFYIIICIVDDQYDFLGDKWAHHGLSRAIGAALLAFTFLLAFGFLFKVDGYSRGTFLSQLCVVMPALVATRTLIAQEIERAAKHGRLQGHKLLVISIGRSVNRSEIVEKLCVSHPHKILNWYDLHLQARDNAGDGALTDYLSEVRNECRKLRGDVVVLVFESSGMKYISELVEFFSELPVRIHLLPIGLMPLIRTSRLNQSGHLRVLEISSGPSSLVDRCVKRTFDLVIATTAIILLSPLMLLTAVAIKMDSRGPVLFRQLRHGFNNEPIYVLKFRTMVVSEETGEFRQTTRNDPRITPLGHFLRRMNVDELPQLFNVLRGDMSIVGPRPHALAHNDMFSSRIKRMSRRHNVKPGITGWAQVNGFRGETDTYEKMLKRIEYDLYYIDNWSFFFDVKVIFRTLLSPKAYTNAY